MSTINRKIVIVVRGTSEAEVQSAVDEANSRISQGFTSGTDRNDNSGFYFDVSDDVPESERPA